MERNLRPKTDKDFGAPPPGYIPGIGRGAIGFASGISRDRPTRVETEKETDLADSNYDAFTGYSGSLFDGTKGDAEDLEADQIYDLVDSRMESRRKKAKEERLVKEAVQAREKRPNMQQQFADYKKQLAAISEEDWMKIPEAQERLKAKRVTKESVLTAPDRILAGEGGLNEVGQAKQAVLELSLDKTDSTTAVDGALSASEYLAQMETATNTFAGDIAEVKKARLLFKSITRSDPTNATGWLAAARLEEVVGNVTEAKGIIARGITNCPLSEDLWVNAIRLESDRVKAKSVVANGIRQNPKSVVLWTEAARLEALDSNKVRVLQKSLEVNKASIPLWKNLINLVSSTSSTADVLVLFERAVKCCPTAEEFWLTYAKLSDYSAAQKILNDARKHIPTSVAVWIAAAELAAAMGAANVDLILEKAMKSLKMNGITLSKSGWLEEASKVQSTQVVDSLTRITIMSAIDQGLHAKTAKEVKHEILSDFDSFVDKNSIVARSILATAARETELRDRKGIWVKWLQYEQQHDEYEKIAEIFESAVAACPQAEILWLMYAKYLFSTVKNSNGAKQVLNRAMDNVPGSEEIYLAAVKVVETSDRQTARQILAHAREVCPESVRVWMRSAQIERWDRNTDKCLSLVEGALVVLRPSLCWKLLIIAAHACMENSQLSLSEKWIERGIDLCPNKAPVWAVAADIAIQGGNLNKARSILERGRIRLSNDEILWWKGYVVEVMSGGAGGPGTRVFLSRALQACPNSGLLWAYAIDHEPVVTRHPKCLDALKKCENDPLVVAAVARFFWIEKKQIDKARKWFQNAARMDDKYGQVWADFLAFEMVQGDDNYSQFDSALQQIEDLDKSSVVNKGGEWNQFRKRLDNWGKESSVLIFGYSKERFPDIWSNISPRIAGKLDK